MAFVYVALFVLLLIFMRRQIGWILFGFGLLLWWIWKTFWRIVALPFHFLWWLLHEIERQWYLSDPSVLFAKAFTTILILVLLFKGFHLLVK
jgi:hypothetical protein